MTGNGLALAAAAWVCAPIAAAASVVMLCERRRRRAVRRVRDDGLVGLGLVAGEIAEHPVSFGPVDQPDAEECALTLDERREFAALRHEIEAALAEVTG